MAQPGFWDNAERAQGIVQKKKLCFGVVDPIDTLTRYLEDCQVFLELGAEDPAAVEADLVETERKINERLDQLEFQLMLGGEHDPMNAIITLQSGAGGVDASDWAEMMLRMYIKWATKKDYEFEWGELFVTSGKARKLLLSANVPTVELHTVEHRIEVVKLPKSLVTGQVVCGCQGFPVVSMVRASSPSMPCFAVVAR